MRTIKIKTVDDGPWLKKDSCPFSYILSKYYKIEFSDTPDFLFYSCFGTEFLNYQDCIRIFYTGENVRPDFNQCDYAIGYDRMTFGERYIRSPKYAVRAPFKSDINYVNRKFCNFLYSNANSGLGATKRIDFFNLLSKYKQIDSPGRVCNNMSHPVANTNVWSNEKITFLSGYKFTIAFENDIYPGYVTEKIIHPFRANSIPIYCGDPDITIDFNQNAFININSFPSFEAAIEYIKYIDNNDIAYMKMLTEPPMRLDYTPEDIPSFIINIIDNGKRYPRNIRNNIFYQPYNSFYNIILKFIDTYLSPLTNKYSLNTIDIMNFLYSNTYISNIKIDIFLYAIQNLVNSSYSLLKTNNQIKDLMLEQELQIIRFSKILSIQSKNKKQITWQHTYEDEKKFRYLFNLLWPHNIDSMKKIRIGDKGDGGCIMINPDNNSLGIMIGRKGTCKWLKDIVEVGGKSIVYNTFSPIAYQFEKNIIHICKDVVTKAENLNKQITFQQIIDTLDHNKDILLFVDIEGKELDIFDTVTSDQLSCFKQIYCEFHGILNMTLHSKLLKIFKRFLKTHIPIHLHQHNYGPFMGFTNFIVSNIWEVSFVRNDIGKCKKSKDSFPTILDAPNINYLPDVFTGKFDHICKDI